MSKPTLLVLEAFGLTGSYDPNDGPQAPFYKDFHRRLYVDEDGWHWQEPDFSSPVSGGSPSEGPWMPSEPYPFGLQGPTGPTGPTGPAGEDGAGMWQYTVGPTSEYPYTSIQDAITDVLSDGSHNNIIYVTPGVYAENLSLGSANVVIKGLFGNNPITNSGAPTIDGSITSDAGGTVTLESLTVLGQLSGLSSTWRLSNCTFDGLCDIGSVVRAKNCRWRASGIALEVLGAVSLTDCIFTEAASGFRLTPQGASINNTSSTLSALRVGQLGHLILDKCILSNAIVMNGPQAVELDIRDTRLATLELDTGNSVVDAVTRLDNCTFGGNVNIVGSDTAHIIEATSVTFLNASGSDDLAFDYTGSAPSTAPILRHWRLDYAAGYSPTPTTLLGVNDAYEAEVTRWIPQKNALGTYWASGNSTETVITDQNVEVKANIVTTSSPSLLVNFEHDGNNRLSYTGTRPTYFAFSTALTVDDGAGTRIDAFYRVFPTSGSPFNCSQCTNTAQIPPGGAEVTFPIQAIIPLSEGDYVEVWIRNTTSTSNITVININTRAIEVL